MSFVLKPLKTAKEGAVPAKSFYGAVDPTLALKVLKGVPSLKAAFTAGMPDSKPPPAQKQTKEKRKGKTCTGYFGCTNLAVFQEPSGTLFCRDHKPKQVQTVVIQSEKSAAKKGSKK